MYVNKIGLEAEYLLRNESGELVFPEDYNFKHDDFPILGEFRAEPGKDRSETVANFLKKYYEVLHWAKKKKLTVDITGFGEVSPKSYVEIMRKMATKEISTCQNIYGTDILELSDAVVVDGKIVTHNISCGLHVHFSSEDSVSRKSGIPLYEKVELPQLYLNKDFPVSFGNLYKLTGYKDNDEIKVSVSRITKPVINYIVKEMDEKLLINYKSLIFLKYREKGFYELKDYGFEYRSLPFNQNILKDIYEITDMAFNLLESL